MKKYAELYCLLGILLIAGCGKQEAGGTEPQQPDSQVTENNANESAEQSGIKYSGIVQQEELAEYAGADYRPEGYHKNIKDGLALKMSVHKEDAGYIYSVVLYCTRNEPGVLTAVNEINSNRSGIQIDSSEWIPVTLDIDWDYFYAELYADELEILAEYDVECMYVGSGKEPTAEIDWADPEWIDQYCEHVGDCLTGTKDNLDYDPDLIMIEDGQTP